MVNNKQKDTIQLIFIFDFKVDLIENKFIMGSLVAELFVITVIIFIFIIILLHILEFFILWDLNVFQ